MAFFLMIVTIILIMIHLFFPFKYEAPIMFQGLSTRREYQKWAKREKKSLLSWDLQYS